MNKPVFYIILLILLPFLGRAQMNLVPNGSFEEYWECPTGNDLNNDQLEKCKYWWKPTFGTSDYSNSCNSGVVSVPDNLWGHQEAYDGDGYVGLVPANWNTNNGSITDCEYVQTKLIQPLTACQEYRFTMHVSLAEASKYCFTKLGAVVSKDSIFSNDYNMLVVNDNIIYGQNLLCDTVNWMEVSGVFTSSGNEKYLTIGLFFGLEEADTVFFQNIPFFPEYGYGYYYIDDVSLIELGEDDLCEIKLPNVFTPNHDGINDLFEFDRLNSLENLEFYVLNRWGNVIFDFNTTNKYNWDGRTNQGMDCSEGVYYFSYQGTTKTGNTKKQTGFIQLIR